MHEGKMVFSQVMAALPWRRFQTCVDRHEGDYKIISLWTSEFFKVMAFAQITGRKSLRGIALCLNALPTQRYHLGIRSEITKSNLAHANNKRSWKIFHDFAQVLVKETTKLYRDDAIQIDLDAGVYALDSTTIDLCLSLFPWAHFRKTKSAVKMHTMINLRGKIPGFILISTGKMHDVNAMDAIVWEPGCWYVMDRGYLDFQVHRRRNRQAPCVFDQQHAGRRGNHHAGL